MLKFTEFICCFIFVASIITVVASSGFDSIECDPHSNKARTGRARLIASIPCDLSKQSYCNLPGEFYPWNAVKKFVYENQGLVRRMYGDMRHIFVMQSELENEVDFEDLQHSADKYSKAFNSHNQQRQMKAKKVVQERKNFRSESSEPYFRPAQRPSAVNSKQKTKPPKTASNEASENNVLLDNMIKSNIDAIVGDLRTKEEENLTTTSTVPDVSTGSAKLTSFSTSSSSTTPASSSNEKVINEETAEIVSETTEDKLALNLFNNISSLMLSTTSSSVNTSTTLDDGKDKLLFTLKNESVNPSSSLYKLEDEEVAEDALNDLEQVASSVGETFTESTTLDRNISKDPPQTTTTTTETQLFQDTLQKGKEPVQVVNRRGVNACPVKEEVVAPFWGNNTRGEVLALLNVYPFEQYINWEKCTHEHEQMYCRSGCKCEQQYRLHRLLAYNPLDACRGIFSDWFRFPSCCICKCYDIPFDYRVTSRSPRGSDKVFQSDDNEEGNSFPLFEDDKSIFDPE